MSNIFRFIKYYVYKEVTYSYSRAINLTDMGIYYVVWGIFLRSAHKYKETVYQKGHVWWFLYTITFNAWLYSFFL